MSRASFSRVARSCPIHGGPSRLAGRCRPQVGVRSLHDFTREELEAIIPTAKGLNIWKGDDITVAMSGGVDSSVVLRILSEFNVNLRVVFMRNWDAQLSESAPSDQDDTTSLSYSGRRASPSSLRPQDSPCGWQRDWEYVQKVCDHVGIPPENVKLVDLSREYWTRVFEPALTVWGNGGTPNPDVACNREIKFGALMKSVPRHPRSFIATGHYSRVKRMPHGVRLCRPTDADKDQTYYLSSISEDQLRRAIFPLAEIKKPMVRELARYYGLPTAEREESMGLCFVGERGKFGNFISQYIPKPEVQGHLVNLEGKRLKQHQGLWTYTVGQNAGIGGMLDKMFVAKKGVGASGQDILVVPGREHPAMMTTRVMTHDFHWIHGKVPKGIVPGGTKKALVQVRHRMEPIPALITHSWDGGGLTVNFPEPVQGVAPGQVLTIFYYKWCLGSGVIKETWTSDILPARSVADFAAEKGKAFKDDPDEDEEQEEREVVKTVVKAQEPGNVGETDVAASEVNEPEWAKDDAQITAEDLDAVETVLGEVEQGQSEAPSVTATPSDTEQVDKRPRARKTPMENLTQAAIEVDPTPADPFEKEFLRLYNIDPGREISPWQVVDFNQAALDGTLKKAPKSAEVGYGPDRYITPSAARSPAAGKDWRAKIDRSGGADANNGRVSFSPDNRLAAPKPQGRYELQQGGNNIGRRSGVGATRATGPVFGSRRTGYGLKRTFGVKESSA